ncbi:serine O-acetyltransferase EpsC [Mucilaginibacter sp.]|uniref:serine O-acetyltransferase EpsC n=1 Tax=Mucilaginibacter sp. TaxID=1882438 RepID=UPI003AFFC90C
MTEQEFYQHLLSKKQQMEAVPSNEEIALWALRLFGLLFPERAKMVFTNLDELKEAFISLKKELFEIMEATGACQHCDNYRLTEVFFDNVPELYRILNTDIKAIFEGDPAAKTEFEVIRTYPGFYAIAFYRIAHTLYLINVPLLPRILTEYAHSKTGIDIHPAAIIGEYLAIDHGTGTVIGETSVIGNHVKLYQGVTLGAMSVDKSMADIKRHPTVEDGVIIYSGATILGGSTVIGRNSIIGGNVWLTKSVPPGSVVYHKPNIKVIEGKISS